MIETPRPGVLTLFTTFYDLSVSRNIFSKVEKRIFGATGIKGLMAKSVIPAPKYRLVWPSWSGIIDNPCTIEFDSKPVINRS